MKCTIKLLPLLGQHLASRAIENMHGLKKGRNFYLKNLTVNDYLTECFGTQQQEERGRCLDNSVVFGVVTIEKGGVQKILLEICYVDAQCFRLMAAPNPNY